MSFAPVKKELQITKRQRTSLTALSKKYIYPSVITSWREESLQNQTVRVRCSSYRFSIGSRLLSLSFFLYSRIIRCFTILVTFLAVVFPQGSLLVLRISFLWKEMFEIYIHI